MSADISAASAAGPQFKKVDVGGATHWIAEGWRMFVAAPGAWIAIALVVIVVQMATMLFPILMVAGVMVVGGLMGGCFAAAGGPIRFTCLFDGYGGRGWNLLLLGIVLFICGIVVWAISGMVLMLGGGGVLVSALLENRNLAPDTMFASLFPVVVQFMGVLLLALLTALLLLLPVLMAGWFAPALIVVSGVSVGQAMKCSFAGCQRNWLPLTVYSILWVPLILVASIPAFLGWLILIPVLVGSIYASYRDIYSSS